jgi:threonine synthase
VFAELSGAAGLAGMRASLTRGRLSRTATAVVLVTGSGFKDLELRASSGSRRIDFEPDTDDLGDLEARIRAGGFDT